MGIRLTKKPYLTKKGGSFEAKYYEFFDTYTQKGGLIEIISQKEMNKLVVNLYRLDKGIIVRKSYD